MYLISYSCMSKGHTLKRLRYIKKWIRKAGGLEMGNWESPEHGWSQSPWAWSASSDLGECAGSSTEAVRFRIYSPREHQHLRAGQGERNLWRKQGVSLRSVHLENDRHGCQRRRDLNVQRYRRASSLIGSKMHLLDFASEDQFQRQQVSVKGVNERKGNEHCVCVN